LQHDRAALFFKQDKMPAGLRSLVACALLLHFGGANAADPHPAPKGNAASGEQVYARCMACHSLTENRIGPRHCGVFGHHAGAVPGFDYSPAMRRAKIIWDDKTLDAFLADPLKYLPGTAMVFAGVPDPQERADVIAWLKAAGAESAGCSPKGKR
jgi:cytochrome c